MEFLSKDLTKKLIEKGCALKSLFVYNDEQCINDDVVEKYGHLSDDGYYELTKDGGGDLDFNYVYQNKTDILLKRDVIVPRNMMPCYLTSHILQWLRKEKHIFIEISVSIDLNGDYHYNYSVLNETCQYIRKGYTSFEWDWHDAASNAIEFVIDNLI